MLIFEVVDQSNVCNQKDSQNQTSMHKQIIDKLNIDGSEVKLHYPNEDVFE